LPNLTYLLYEGLKHNFFLSENGRTATIFPMICQNRREHIHIVNFESWREMKLHMSW